MKAVRKFLLTFAAVILLPFTLAYVSTLAVAVLAIIVTVVGIPCIIMGFALGIAWMLVGAIDAYKLWSRERWKRKTFKIVK